MTSRWGARCSSEPARPDASKVTVRACPKQFDHVAGKRIGKRKRVRFDPATMPEREVKKIAAEFLRPLNQGLTPIGAAVAFADSTFHASIPHLQQ